MRGPVCRVICARRSGPIAPGTRAGRRTGNGSAGSSKRPGRSIARGTVWTRWPGQGRCRRSNCPNGTAGGEDVEEVLATRRDALKSRIPGRELAAHLGAVGASQDAVDKAERRDRGTDRPRQGSARRRRRSGAPGQGTGPARRRTGPGRAEGGGRTPGAGPAKGRRIPRPGRRALPGNLQISGWRNCRRWSRGEQQSGRDGWLRDLRGARDEAKALKADIPGPELAAHERAAGASPGAVDRSAEDIAKRIAEELERRELARIAEQAWARAAEEQERREQERARIAEQERARAAEERERQAREQARIAAENARAAQNEEDERREREAATRPEPYHQAHLPTGTPVALTSLNESADRDTVFKMLDALKTSYPDLFFIHGQTMAPSMKFAEEWARGERRRSGRNQARLDK